MQTRCRVTYARRNQPTTHTRAYNARFTAGTSGSRARARAPQALAQDTPLLYVLHGALSGCTKRMLRVDTMTRKDYIRIARALIYARMRADARDADRERDWSLAGVFFAADYIAGELERDTRGFDREHFLAAVRGEKSLESRPPRRKEASCQHPTTD